MSNALTIAAVTATLRTILQAGIDAVMSGVGVTILPLDKARVNNSGNQINLYLYQVVRNAAWSNRDMPRQVQPGETGFPPLALDLHYLITAFGQGDDVTNPLAHELLGVAMSLLHDHPVLSAADIQAANLSGSDLDKQIEKLRVTLHPLSLDEMSKLWTGFASQYRLSAAYEVGVALIESTRGTKAPLPVLARGQGDTGVSSQADLTPPLPTLDSLAPLNPPSVQMGESVTLTGFHLDGANAVRFQHALWTDPIDVAPDSGGTDKKISVTIPNATADWPAGFYSVVVVLPDGVGGFRSTNQLPMALAPKISIMPATASPGDGTFKVTTTPQAWPDQRVTLLLGDQEIRATPFAVKTDTLTFAASGLKKGVYWCRLRVDGVDSLLVDRTVSPPAFIASQGVTVQ